MFLADQPESVGSAGLKTNACGSCQVSAHDLASDQHPAALDRTFAYMTSVYVAIDAARSALHSFSDAPAGESAVERQQRRRNIQTLRHLIRDASEQARLSCCDGSIVCGFFSCNIDVYQLSPCVERVRFIHVFWVLVFLCYYYYFYFFGFLIISCLHRCRCTHWI